MFLVRLAFKCQLGQSSYWVQSSFLRMAKHRESTCKLTCGHCCGWSCGAYNVRSYIPYHEAQRYWGHLSPVTWKKKVPTGQDLELPHLGQVWHRVTVTAVLWLGAAAIGASLWTVLFGTITACQSSRTVLNALCVVFLVLRIILWHKQYCCILQMRKLKSQEVR